MTFFIHLTFFYTISLLCFNDLFFFHFILLFYVFLRLLQLKACYYASFSGMDSLISIYIVAGSFWKHAIETQLKLSKAKDEKLLIYVSKPQRCGSKFMEWLDPGARMFSELTLVSEGMRLSFPQQTFPIGQSTSQQIAPGSPLYSAETS